MFQCPSNGFILTGMEIWFNFRSFSALYNETKSLVKLCFTSYAALVEIENITFVAIK